VQDLQIPKESFSGVLQLFGNLGVKSEVNRILELIVEQKRWPYLWEHFSKRNDGTCASFTN